MISFKGMKIRNLVLLVMLAVVVPLAILSSFTQYIIYRAELRRHVDVALQIAATFAKELLQADYHDRIENENSVSTDEFDQIAVQHNQLCIDLGLESIWSLMIYDERLVFTSTTSPDKHTHNHTHTKFFEEHSAPELYEKTFQTMEPQLLDIIEKWGSIRAVLIPHYDSHGRKYLFGASQKLQHIEAMTPYILRNTLITTAIFLIPGILISLVASRWLTRPIARLAEMAEQIGKGEFDQKFDIAGAYEINAVSEQLKNMNTSIKEHIKTTDQSYNELSRFHKIVSSSPIIVYRLQFIPGDWPIEFVSENVTLLGYSQQEFLTGKTTWNNLNHPADIPNAERVVQEAIDNKQNTFNLVSRIMTASGEIRHMESWNRFIRDDSGNVIQIHGLFKDVTKNYLIQERNESIRSELEKAVSELQEFHQIVTNSPILIYQVKTDEDMSTEFISDNYSLLGYDIEKLRSGEIKWKELIPEEDLERVEKIVEKSLSEGSDTHTSQIRIRWANGTYHWYTCWNQFLFDEMKSPIAIQGIMADITDQKEALNQGLQYQGRLKALTRDLEEAEDNERRRLAYALHDDIGQMLAGLNMKLSVLKETSDRKQINALAEQVDELLNKIMRTVKTLTWEISPTTLYESDIAAGLEHMAGEIEKYFELHISIETAGVRVELDKESASFIFRCSKELLVNIAKHAGVKDAVVGITQYGDKVHLVVSDQGKGFDTHLLDQSTPPGFGLFSIRERIEYMNGSLHIESAPDKGTKVMLILPLDISALL